MIVLSGEPVVKTLTRGEDVFGFRPAWTSPAEFLYTADGRIWRRTIGNTTRRVVPMFAGVAVSRPPQGLKTAISPGPGPHIAAGLRGVRTDPSTGNTAFTALGDLWLRDEDGELRQLTNDPYLDIDPAFVPNGQQLIFASDRAGGMDLWSIDLDDGHLEQLTFGPAKSYAPDVSPDGAEVAFLSTAGFGPWAEAELRVLTLGHERRARTLARGLRDASDVRWSRSADTISVWASNPDSRSEPGAPRARFEIDAAGDMGYWTREPGPADEKPATDPDGASPTWTPPPPVGEYVIQVDRLFDGVGTQYRRHVDIHVDGRRIAAVVARGLRPLPAKVIDARGYTAVPGLIELHAHQSALSGERLGRAWLAFGVTTVREVASIREDGLERRESWSSGRRLGPRLLLSARQDQLGGWPAPGAPSAPTYDIAEIYRGEPPQLSLAVRQEARRFGIPVFSEELFPAVRFGINGLEHLGGRALTPYDLERSSLSRSYADVVDALTLSGTAVTPALAAFGGYAVLASRRSIWAEDPAYRRLFSSEERAAWRAGAPDAEMLSGLEATIGNLVRAGARVAAGSDAPSVPYGLGLHAELALLNSAGVPADQALRLVTAEAALALGLERDIGTIEAGKLADLVILNGNPLIDMGDTLKIIAVVRDGVWYDRERLMSAE